MSILRALRARVVRVRDAIDARLHPRRRHRARLRLRDARPRSILFVCLGNVCRSPYAARAAASRASELGAGPSLLIDSAGFIGPGRPPPDDALKAARRLGVDHADHVSRVLTRETLEAADAVFVFDRFNVGRLRGTPGARLDRVFWLGDFDPVWTGKRAIIDPWGKPLEAFEATFSRIDRCVEDVLSAALSGEDHEAS